HNSSDTSGLGTDVGRELELRDFDIESIGNADQSVYVKGAATIYHGEDGRDNALLLQKQIPGAKLWDDARSGDSVQLVLGYGFDKLVDEPDPPLPAPSEISLNADNTTYKEGLAADVADELEDREGAAEAARDDAQVIRYAPAGARAARRRDQHATGVQLQKAARPSPKVHLVLGSKWSDLQPQSSVPEAEPYERPAETIQKPCGAE